MVFLIKEGMEVESNNFFVLKGWPKWMFVADLWRIFRRFILFVEGVKEVHSNCRFPANPTKEYFGTPNSEEVCDAASGALKCSATRWCVAHCYWLRKPVWKAFEPRAVWRAINADTAGYVWKNMCKCYSRNCSLQLTKTRQQKIEIVQIFCAFRNVFRFLEQFQFKLTTQDETPEHFRNTENEKKRNKSWKLIDLGIFFVTSKLRNIGILRNEHSRTPIKLTVISDVGRPCQSLWKP